MSEDAPDDIAKFFSNQSDDSSGPARPKEEIFGGKGLGQFDMAAALSSVREFQQNRERALQDERSRNTNDADVRSERSRSMYASSARTNEALEQIRKRERFVVRFTWGLSAFFILCIALAVVFADDNLSTRAYEFIRAASNPGAGPTVNCRDPRFAKTAQCLDKEHKLEADWKAITRFQDGKTNPFAIHGKE